jgi:hypothetical protein
VTTIELHSGETVALNEDSLWDSLSDSDATCRELYAFGRQKGLRRCEVHDVFRPLADDLGISDCGGRAAKDSERAIPHLVAVAVGAMEDVSCPALAKAWDVRKFVT